MKPWQDLKNELPQDGEAYYVAGFLDEKEALRLFKDIRAETSWRSEEITLFGRKILQPRLMAWLGDSGVRYKYSGLQLEAEPWTQALLLIKNKVEEFCGEDFNSVLLNYYRDQKDSMGWHSDDEKELGQNPIIASMSLGATRDFHFKHKVKSDLKVKRSLESGSLLIMAGSTQHYWNHNLPKRTKFIGPRINLTFRKILN